MCSVRGVKRKDFNYNPPKDKVVLVNLNNVLEIQAYTDNNTGCKLIYINGQEQRINLSFTELCNALNEYNIPILTLNNKINVKNKNNKKNII